MSGPDSVRDGRDDSQGWLARPPAWGFYGFFALVSGAIFMGATELHDWGGTNFPNTGAELLGLVGWWTMGLVVAPIWVLRFARADAGALRSAGSLLPLLRWLAAPAVVVGLGVLSVTEVIPHATGHYALTDPADNRAVAEQVVRDAVKASGFAAIATEGIWEGDFCDSYPGRRADFIEITFRGMTASESERAIERIDAHWSTIAAEREWEDYQGGLSGDQFDFAVSRVFDEQKVQLISLTGRTPCTVR